jgi:tetratricopeptide (TPR) repeat protein
MKIVATTLCKNNENIIQDALLSVLEHVDQCILIDTGCTDATVEKAREVAGDKLHVVSWPWQKDFAAARNASLDFAASVGADWAITLDSDERLVVEGSLRELLSTLTEKGPTLDTDDDGTPNYLLLSSCSVAVVSSYQIDGTYEKPRILRVPSASRWVGATHEYLQRGDQTTLITLPQVRFSELGKSVEGAKHKFERDIEILLGEIKKDPTNTRWHFYLGDSYRNSARLEQAAQAYEACAALKGWDEEAAWACYRAAEIRGQQGNRLRAIELCAQGLGLHPGIAELAWLAGFHSFYLGRMHHAVHWSRLALTMGMYKGDFQDTARIGFRDMPALWERPYDVLRFALRALGKHEEAQHAENDWKAAQALRETKFKERYGLRKI